LSERPAGVYELELDCSLDSSLSEDGPQSRSFRSAAVEAQAKALGFELPQFESQSLGELREAVLKFFSGIEQRLQEQYTLLDNNPEGAYEVLVRGLEANLAQTHDPGVKDDFKRFLGIAAQHIREITDAKASGGQPNCVRIRLGKLQQYRNVCGMLARGFDEKSDPQEQMQALPMSASNSEGLRLFATVIEALDGLADSEGRSKLEAAQMSLLFQRMGNVFLEHHNIVDPRWRADNEAGDDEALEAVRVLDSLATRAGAA